MAQKNIIVLLKWSGTIYVPPESPVEVTDKLLTIIIISLLELLLVSKISSAASSSSENEIDNFVSDNKSHWIPTSDVVLSEIVPNNYQCLYG